MSTVRLVTYGLIYTDWVQAYQVDSTLPVFPVRRSMIQPHKVLGLVDDKLVSFCFLDTSDKCALYEGDARSLLLRSFSTDSRYVRQGFARQMIQALPAFI